jgi:hypothetical protein
LFAITTEKLLFSFLLSDIFGLRDWLVGWFFGNTRVSTQGSSIT